MAVDRKLQNGKEFRRRSIIQPLPGVREKGPTVAGHVPREEETGGEGQSTPIYWVGSQTTWP
jgi:hypothetical protein